MGIVHKTWSEHLKWRIRRVNQNKSSLQDDGGRHSIGVILVYNNNNGSNNNNYDKSNSDYPRLA